MKQISSGIIGSPNRGPQAASSIGAGRGETGFVATSTVASNREMHPDLVGRMPSANLGAALSRMSSLGVECFVKTETVFPATADGDTTFRQRPTSLSVNIAASADLPAALKVINASLAPASTETIEEWLAILSVKTIQRTDSAGRVELMVSTYAAHLREYPADVVRFVLAGWSGKWWPTWGELAERMDELTDQRLMIRDHLAGLVTGAARKTDAIDPVAQRLKQLRDELAAAERVASRYPDLADSSLRKREAMAAEIQHLEKGA